MNKNFIVHPLYSSSSGNMTHIACSNTNILIDVGVSYKAIREGLSSINLTLNDIDAILITHEHIDHIKGLPLLCRKNNIPIFTCKKTAEYIKNELESKNIQYNNIFPIEYNQPFIIKDIQISAFETSHDALMPCGYKLRSTSSCITFATDLGYVSDDVFNNLDCSNYTILESNYDETMIDFGKYPFPVKQRIKSNIGHLSNDVCGQTIARLAQNGHSRFLLTHLSENNNTQEIARQTIESILKENSINISKIEINFESKTLSNEEYIIC